MIQIRPSNERGHYDHGWLDSFHTFSFGEYHEPAHMGFRALRVINEDKIQPGTGFGRHGHRDMEIVTYVLAGALTHEDSTGSKRELRPGDVQHMSAGRGILHSEHNASRDEVAHILQVWILPEREGIEPGYAERHFSGDERRGRLRLIAAPDGRDGALRIRQDAELRAAILAGGDELEHELRPGRHAWVQLARGEVELNGRLMQAGDGAGVSGEKRLVLRALHPGELLLFDLA